jgi:EAL domain-containing protein (putative c-di-GMP-specific phosphodiesterase class I)/ActR/RegA family two-component response regulator
MKRLRAAPDSDRPACILVADDEPGLLDIVTTLLNEAGYRTIAASTGTAAMEHARRENVDVVLTDISMPGATGVEVLRSVRQHNIDTPVILMTGNPTVPTAVEALKLGALGYLAKPVPAEKLLDAVGEALALARLTRLRRQALAELGGEERFIADRAGLEALFGRAQAGLWTAYQPVVWARDAKRFGHEALLRTTAREVPHPGVLLDAAERLERVAELGRQVRANVARDLDTLTDAVLVNLHPLDLADPELGAEADPLSLHANRVVLEITERAPLERVGDLRDLVARLRARGFRIAVDDLGAGYAALSSFASLEPDVVKLDMSLVRDVDHHPTRRKLVASITELCRDLGILVVAEGIETESERDVLVDLGCDLLQGFLLGRPEPLHPVSLTPA